LPLIVGLGISPLNDELGLMSIWFRTVEF